MLAVERDVKPRNMNFAKVERGGAINREGAFITKNTVFYKFQRKAGLRLNTSPLPVHGPASLTLMRKYEITEFLE